MQVACLSVGRSDGLHLALSNFVLSPLLLSRVALLAVLSEPTCADIGLCKLIGNVDCSSLV